MMVLLVLKREPFASQKALLFRTIARRFRAVVWGAIAVLLFTGPLLLHQRGIPSRIHPDGRWFWRPSWGSRPPVFS